LVSVVGTNGAFGPLKITACGLSAARPAETMPKFWTILASGLRNQVNPGTYCASIVSGISSWPGFRPSLNIVRKLQDCPPRNDVPQFSLSMVA
jgi:hypothetical protein